MRGHDAGGVGEALGILDEGPLEGVGIVRGPDLVAVAKGPVVHAAAAGGAALNQHVRVFLPDAAHHVVQALDIGNVEFVLRGAQVRAAKALDNAVAVPFDVVDVRGQLHGAVKDAIDKVLHGRVGQVQHPLVAALINFAAGALHHPFRMGVGQVRVRIHHLRLNPDAKLEPLGVSVGGYIVNAFRQFFHIDLPVPEARIVGVAGEVVAKPAVVQHKHLQAHPGGIVNHPKERFRGKGEVGAFPAVEQGGIHLPAAVHAVFPGPAVEVAGGSAGALAGPGVNHFRGFKTLAGGQGPGAGIRADAGKDGEAPAGIAVEAQAVVAAPGQGAGNDLAGGFAELPGVQAQKERGVVPLGGLHAAAALDDFKVVPQHLLLQLHFLCPGAPGVGQQVIFGVQVQGR